MSSAWLQRTAIGLLVLVTVAWLVVHPMLMFMVWPLPLSALLARKYPRAMGVFLVALGVVVTTAVTYLAITESEEWDEVESEGLSSEPAFWVALTLIPPIAGLLLLATRSRRARPPADARDTELQAQGLASPDASVLPVGRGQRLP